jgi:hypothetical protein
MTPDTVLAIVFLGPPAVYGLAIIIEDWLEHRRRTSLTDHGLCYHHEQPMRVWDYDTHQRLYHRDRHPSAPRGPEDDPSWGQR